MGWEIVEELARIHDGGPSSGVETLEYASSPWEVYRILADVVILTPIFHVGDHPPLARLSWLRHREQWCVPLHLLALWDELKHPDAP
jgi:hypothetical protein